MNWQFWLKTSISLTAHSMIMNQKSYRMNMCDRWANNAGKPWRGKRPPTASINFVTAHDGFTLSDLVAYNLKHNDANGESGADGESHNLSWNCGEEGESARRDVNVSGVQVFNSLNQNQNEQ